MLSNQNVPDCGTDSTRIGSSLSSNAASSGSDSIRLLGWLAACSHNTHVENNNQPAWIIFRESFLWLIVVLCFLCFVGFFPHNTGCGQLNNRYCGNNFELLVKRNRQYFYSWLLNCKQKNSADRRKFARLVMMFGRRYQSSRPTSAAPRYAKSRRWHRTEVRGSMVRCDSAKASAR